MHRLQRIGLQLTAMCAVFSWSAALPSDLAGRAWTVQDAVTARRVVVDWDSPLSLSSSRDEAVQISPDGRRFAVATHWGDFACDCNRFELSIYSTEDVNRALASGSASPPKPLQSVRMSSTSRMFFNNGGIRELVWQDNDTLVFYGTGENQPDLTHRGPASSVYRLDVRTGKLQRLTDPRHDVQSFDIQGDQVVYLSQTIRRNERDEAGIPVGFNRYPMQPLRGTVHRGGLGPFLILGEININVGIFSAREGGPARTIVPAARSDLFAGVILKPRISPDGRWAVVAAPFEKGKPVPQEWRQYAGLEAPYALLPQTQLFRLQQLLLVDLATGKTRTLWEPPLGPVSLGTRGAARDVLWSPDSRHVTLVNVTMPLTADQPERRQMTYLVNYEVETGKWAAIEPMGRPIAPAQGGDASANTYAPAIFSAGWAPSGAALRVTYTDKKNVMQAGESKLYSLRNGHWVPKAESVTPPEPKSVPATLAGGLSVTLREGPNEPQRLIASNGRQELTLIGEDPQLTGVWRAPVQEVQWTERADHIEKGGLMLPKGGCDARPCPLVIQVSVYDPKHFLPDGNSAAAYASQSLVAQGMAVLQINGDSRPAYLAAFQDKAGTTPVSDAPWVRGPVIVERIDAAVEMLAQRGLVDPKRVGLVGFSFMGFLVDYTVSHPGKITPAAALVADSGLRNYTESLANEATFGDELTPQLSGVAADATRYYGGTFWDAEARARWLEHAPAFNTDRVETPVLFVYHRSLGANADHLAETLGAFRLNRREMDLMMISNSDHQLAKPRQREASMQATLDWMSFWLLGREDAAPEKADQYWYWRTLKAQKAARDAKKETSPPRGS